MTQLGKYELHEELGRGGFGSVYRATDTTLGREVALKVLHPQLTTDPDFLEKFRAEARLVASLENPHIVTIYDLDVADGRVFIAMRYMAGGSLKDRLEQESQIPLDAAVSIMRQISAGLQAAHKRGLVHRDIKPGNILFDAEGNAVVGDFGLAKAVQNSSVSAVSSMAGVGTPAYRAPELWLGKPPASPATDIYSLGCVLAEMLTGKALFDGDSTDVVITQHLVIGPEIPAELPQGIRDILARALAKDAQQRYQSTTELMRDLEKVNEQAQGTLPETAAIRLPQAEQVQPLVAEVISTSEKPSALPLEVPKPETKKHLPQQKESDPALHSPKKKYRSWLQNVAIYLPLLFLFYLARSFTPDIFYILSGGSLPDVLRVNLDVVLDLLFGFAYGGIFYASLKSLAKVRKNHLALAIFGWGFLSIFSSADLIASFYELVGSIPLFLMILTGIGLFTLYFKLKNSTRKDVYILLFLWIASFIAYLLNKNYYFIWTIAQAMVGAYVVADVLDMVVGLSSKEKTLIVLGNIAFLFIPYLPNFLATLIVLYRKKMRTSVNTGIKES